MSALAAAPDRALAVRLRISCNLEQGDRPSFQRDWELEYREREYQGPEYQGPEYQEWEYQEWEYQEWAPLGLEGRELAHPAPELLELEGRALVRAVGAGLTIVRAVSRTAKSGKATASSAVTKSVTKLLRTTHDWIFGVTIPAGRLGESIGRIVGRPGARSRAGSAMAGASRPRTAMVRAFITPTTKSIMATSRLRRPMSMPSRPRPLPLARQRRGPRARSGCRSAFLP
jgi:hypothetical protein